MAKIIFIFLFFCPLVSFGQEQDSIFNDNLIHEGIIVSFSPKIREVLMQSLDEQYYQEAKMLGDISFWVTFSLFEKRIKKVEFLELEIDRVHLSGSLKRNIERLLIQKVIVEHQYWKKRSNKTINYAKIGIIISNFGEK
jgi:hypothetical protein